MDNIYIRKADRARLQESQKQALSRTLTLSEKIAKLPKWASDHIATLSRQRADAVNALNEFIDGQTPSAMSIQEMVHTGEGTGHSFKTRYVQGDEIRIEAHGLYFSARIGFGREKQIYCSYGSGPYLSTGECALIPTSYQQFKLVTKENIRD